MSTCPKLSTGATKAKEEDRCARLNGKADGDEEGKKEEDEEEGDEEV